MPKGEALEGALKLAARITVNAPLAVFEAKACVEEMKGMTEKEAFARSNRGMSFLARTPDFKEGPRAFIEKRAPRWTGKLGAAAALVDEHRSKSKL